MITINNICHSLNCTANKGSVSWKSVSFYWLLVALDTIDTIDDLTKLVHQNNLATNHLAESLTSYSLWTALEKKTSKMMSA